MDRNRRDRRDAEQRLKPRREKKWAKAVGEQREARGGSCGFFDLNHGHKPFEGLDE
jgi:hypothetical protein